jgi:beta-glucosidase
MTLGRSTAAVAAATVALGALVAGAVAGGTPSTDAALKPTRGPADKGIEKKIDDLVKQMTLQEKLMQLQLDADWQANDDQARAGLGGVFSLTDPAKIDHLQHVAVEQSRLHIPILFAFDTIHGYRTVFPIPLGQASSFDPSVATADDTIGARETATVGIKQIYSPMVDVSHEPRWGRIAEGAGEDPYLGSVFAAARVKAAQGTDYSAPDKVVTSPKHFAAYGQPEGGREYNTTDMSEQRLWNTYLPPFKAAVDAGADTVMCSFNAISGVPGCANHETETDILKHDWKFDGFIESDYTAVDELIRHGIAGNGADAGEAALNGGTDMEMVSSDIRDNAEQLLAEHRISMARIDDAVRRILRVKFRAGLFGHPYVDQTKATDPNSFVTPVDRAAARDAASKSMVLLKNSGNALPLDVTKSVAVIGPLGNDQHDMLGPWWGVGRDSDAVTLFDGIKAQDTNTVTFTPGCTIEDKDPPDNTPAGECGSDAGFPAAIAAATAADQIVLALGECRCMSGEAESRTQIELPGKQQELIDEIATLGKPFVVVLFNGRPLTLSDVAAKSPAILEAWFPGIEAGNAVADVLFGKVNPGGKLPVSFPRVLGQVPIYYNHEPTGRPCDVTFKWNARYRDLAYCDPLYPFGFGLSYTTFSVTNLRLDKQSVTKNGEVTATVDVTNTGTTRKGDDVVQLYIHDPVASISQPVRRLRGFKRVTLNPGEMLPVSFTLDASDYGFYDNRSKLVVEPGEIEVYAGDSSTATLKQTFTVTG